MYQLLGNGCKISNETTAVARQQPTYYSRGKVFSAGVHDATVGGIVGSGVFYAVCAVAITRDSCYYRLV
jgi:hypothetical protein